MINRYKAEIITAEWRTDLWRDDNTFGLQIYLEFDESATVLEFYGSQGEKVMRDLKAKRTLLLIGKEVAVIENNGWVQYDGPWTEEGELGIVQPEK